MPPGCARPRGARCACRCRPMASSRRRHRGASSMPHSSTWRSRPARRFCRGTRSARSGRSPASVEVDVAGVGTINARYVVAADGMWSATRKALGVGEPGYLGEWHAFRQYAGNVTGPAAERLIVWFEPDLLPGLHVELPAARRAGQHRLRRAARRRSSRAGHEAAVGRPAATGRTWSRRSATGSSCEDRHTAWPIPAGIDRATLTSGRVCFVGDAAMATDTMTGEGIGQARAHRAPWRPRRSSPAARWRPTPWPAATDRRCATTCRRSQDVGAAQQGPEPRARGARRHPPAGHQRLDAPQLRPLDVRRRAPSHRLHPVALAPPLPPPTRPLPDLTPWSVPSPPGCPAHPPMWSVSAHPGEHQTLHIAVSARRLVRRRAQPVRRPGHRGRAGRSR